MNLTDLIHINDYFGETVASSPTTDGRATSSSINFIKCQKSVEIVDFMLRHQATPYPFEEDSRVMALVEECLSNAARPQDWFWKRSERIKTRHERSNSEPPLPAQTARRSNNAVAIRPPKREDSMPLSANA